MAVVATVTDSNFNPRPPRGGRPVLGDQKHGTNIISIHAPREGGDGVLNDALGEDLNFNPRPPRGGRLQVCQIRLFRSFNFNPRPPRGGRLGNLPAQTHDGAISIHAPREGGDMYNVI